MATILRHPVPPEFYDPDRPLNDLGRDQLRHFVHVFSRMPESQRAGLVEPSPEDGMASSRFIAEITTRILAARKKPAKPIVMLQKQKQKPKPAAGLALAAAGTKSKAKKAAKKVVKPDAKLKGPKSR